LRDKHPVEDLLRSYLEYATDRLKSLTDVADKLGVSIELSDSEPHAESVLDTNGDADLDLDDLSSFFEKTASGLVQNALAGLTDDAGTATPTEAEEVAEQPAGAESKTEIALAQTNGKVDLMTDYKELEALVAESTSNYVKTTLNGLSPVPYQATVPTSTGKFQPNPQQDSVGSLTTSTAESLAAQLPYLAQLQHHQAQHPYYTFTQPLPEPPQPQAAPGENLPPNQTFSSAILYDKARQAALSKSTAHTRREGLHSTRRPWTQEEEKALMAGLDMVKGPHWSQILTLFGQSGTMSDILKDRTQVQLKDKARNLKLFFLKTNSEMPYYLQAVTGELKTRAPTQAARKEAEERARLNSEEDQAKLQGIMALAGGLQHPPHGRSSASPGTAVGPGVVTPAQAAQAASAVQHQHHVGHQAHHAAGQGAHGTPPMPRPATTPATQMRPGVHANTQHLLHSVAQAHARPQAHLPPQVPRPQGQPQHHQHMPQQQQQQQAQPAQQHLQQQPQQIQLPQAQQPTRTPPAAMPQSSSSSIHAQTHAAAAQKHHVPTPTQPSPTAMHTTHMPVATAPPQTTASPAPTQAPPPTAQPVQQTQAAPAPQQHGTPGPSAPAPAAAPHSQISPPQEAPKPEGLSQQEQDDNAAEAALLEGLQAAVAQSLAS
jgi:hypothetical protein